MLPILVTASLDAEEQGKADYLYRKYRHVLFTCALKIVKDANLAEDAVQNAFASVFLHLDAIVDCDSKSAANYLITATKNFAIQEYKRQKRDSESIVDIEEEAEFLIGESDVWDTVKSHIDTKEIAAAFQDLNEGHRFVLIGKYFLGYSYRELAEQAKTTENAISTRITAAKQKLAKLLENREVR